MKRKLLMPAILSVGLTFGTIWSCQSPKSENKEMEKKEIKFNVNIQEVPVGGKNAKLFTFDNGNGIQVEISSFGGLVTKLLVPDKDGNSENIVLGHDNLDGYDSNEGYLGASVGRYANRIAKGKFELDGNVYQLATNNGNNHLHGGLIGFHRKHWEAEMVESENSMKVRMTYLSADGEEGYPGNLKTTLTYELTADNKLLVEFESETDKPTIVNLTHHGYFNLSAMEENVLGHELVIHADKYTPVNNELIPTGELAPVKGTAFDFNDPHTVGERIAEVSGGYDHNYVIKENHNDELVKIAEVYHPGSGRFMELYSDAPGVQFYSGNFLNGSITTDGIAYTKHMGMCLEPQVFPNSPNEPAFPTASLNPGETYTHRIQFHFSTK
ncbi:aldose epimerase family protein [Aquiflexum sp.]|uniref:aldose epimerase family protein n=1 Tax=Aquiflexum sp. TaxID=1872584 RepID=UPI0035935B43